MELLLYSWKKKLKDSKQMELLKTWGAEHKDTFNFCQKIQFLCILYIFILKKKKKQLTNIMKIFHFSCFHLSTVQLIYLFKALWTIGRTPKAHWRIDPI